ncbi:phage portal protein [Spirosoma sp. HMF3257]|uniref:Phage portal protein n=1 Tax=Spirosoma telluris TaxID=2183553 RepID=A0A327NUQ3_9BACT|nr:phage portal protein [Spirosoma telluris]RAI77584.1 phage portal protein [Spirosoma telluris]
MIQFIRLDHVLLCIPEGATAQARAFYGGVLGLDEIPGNHPSGAIWFQIADIQLHLREEAGGNYSKRHPAFEIANLDEAKQYLMNKGIDIEYSSDIDGRERFFFRDPFDNRIELLQFVD